MVFISPLQQVYTSTLEIKMKTTAGQGTPDFTELLL